MAYSVVLPGMICGHDRTSRHSEYNVYSLVPQHLPHDLRPTPSHGFVSFIASPPLRKESEPPSGRPAPGLLWMMATQFSWPQPLNEDKDHTN